MDKPNATETLGFKVSPAAADELSASLRGTGVPHSAWYDWGDYFGTVKGERSAATTASFAELLGRVDTTA
ncbi:hypothetical protein WMF38_25015 [Sorangium sp. So ce118]